MTKLRAIFSFQLNSHLFFIFLIIIIFNIVYSNSTPKLDTKKPCKFSNQSTKIFRKSNKTYNRLILNLKKFKLLIGQRN